MPSAVKDLPFLSGLQKAFPVQKAFPDGKWLLGGAALSALR